MKNITIHQSPITNHHKLKRDFSLYSYKILIKNLINSGFCFFDPVIDKIDDFHKGIIIRHDVDRKPLKSLKMAEIEHELGIKSIYFFRNRKSVFVPEIMKKIAAMGHEVGYHYENLSSINTRIENVKCKIENETLLDSRLTSQVSREFENALSDFVSNLKKFQKHFQIRFIAAHGSPRSKFNNCDLWKYFDYKKYGIESDFSIIKDVMLYITDAGRSWNNRKVNRRDVSNLENFPQIKSIEDIPEVIKASNHDLIMLNIHPEHWALNSFEWMWIYCYRTLKNLGKRLFLKMRG